MSVSENSVKSFSIFEGAGVLHDSLEGVSVFDRFKYTDLDNTPHSTCFLLDFVDEADFAVQFLNKSKGVMVVLLESGNDYLYTEKNVLN